MTKDSLGNELPKSIHLELGSSWEQIGRASAINTFLLAVAVSMRNGSTVIYDSKLKQATITNTNGGMNTISHP